MDREREENTPSSVQTNYRKKKKNHFMTLSAHFAHFKTNYSEAISEMRRLGSFLIIHF